MVATTDCGEKSKPATGHKVSKPLMEKKRRARINKCLDQLKSLLESHYSTNIRKRKLEKADILELTVKHLRNLQKIQSCSTVASEFSDYQTGFRSCLANLNQYLVMADTLNGGDRWMLSQLCGKLCRTAGRGEVSSTMDSGRLGQTQTQEEARRLHPSAAGPEEGNTGRFNVLTPRSTSTSCRLSSEDAQPSPGGKHPEAAATPAQNSHARSPSHKKCVSVSGRDQAAHTQHNVWRPW